MGISIVKFLKEKNMVWIIIPFNLCYLFWLYYSNRDWLKLRDIVLTVVFSILGGALLIFWMYSDFKSIEEKYSVESEMSTRDESLYNYFVVP